jgi:hypothetical protein
MLPVKCPNPSKWKYKNHYYNCIYIAKEIQSNFGKNKSQARTLDILHFCMRGKSDLDFEIVT